MTHDSTASAELLWSPPDGGAGSRLAEFAAWLGRRHGVSFGSYAELWQWSVDNLAAFWADVAEYFDVARGVAPEDALVDAAMPGAVWFPAVRVNFAERILAAHDDDQPALVARTESGAVVELTGADLRRQVGALAASLRRMGVGEGDRVAAYLPNTEHAVIAFLATASIGAVWTMCAPEFGVRSVLDRLAQTEPKVLIAADGYHFGGKLHDRTAAALQVLGELPTVRACIWVGRGESHPAPDVRDGVALHRWHDVIGGNEPLSCVSLPFDHPLWILFSSGTTGIPKGIVHGHGGMLLEQYKMLVLQNDLRPGDVFYWYTSTSWMMWNVVVSSMLTGATAVVYDGSPTYPDLDVQWAHAAQWGLTHLGTSAGYLTSCAARGLEPGREYDLSRVRFIGSTGSPLPAATAKWVYDAVGRHPQLVSSTGGTDVASGFFGGSPLLPVWAGELSGPMLGVAVASFDDDGKPVVGRDGELVITAPMPTMPLYFWNDPDGSRYRDAYFSTYPGVWRHGDWVEITERGTAIVSGRSDSTLNRGGVRMGTADVYAALTRIPQIADSMMIGVELDDGKYWMPLFVQLADGAELDDELRETISRVIADSASRRHVPDEILAVPGIPRTRTGKRIEVPVKRLFQGAAPEHVASAGSLDDPSLIDHYAAIAAARRTEVAQ
ncbi:acetoacetyl-CoA synthetase [Amycolatopsis bartoniae]|uniref:Acetoacetyl-CoA synthetase n=1 Tax=Amycolatopsis bartoniae TaxID=941986 RepID=A0A8H9J2J5_9PSEU|nr:acetoacetate--CoA ligase [Amycolatopsis bartoniae]MBB2939374.1 acetoacetyl-CoA synthetase [Amycolatopsis bartoniae]TVT06703.1 acetoacetate--CoA ligase [Amycolatopsis bartoniae]GHF83489.1 acetoacetyl-CoA synthetase [Amycolatopsis bartoniae]